MRYTDLSRGCGHRSLRGRQLIGSWLIGSMLLFWQVSWGADDEAPIAYVPPLLGAAGAVVSAGSRGAKIGDLVLCAVAPNHVGLTTRASPTIYWFLSAIPAEEPQFTLAVVGSNSLLLDTTLNPGTEPGFKALPLDAHGVSLREGVDYVWTLSLPAEGDSGGERATVSGYIRYRQAPATLTGLLNGLNGAQMPSVYAGEGVWYDSLWLLSALVRANPDQAGFRRQRLALLESVPLPAPAAYDQAQLAVQ